MSPKQLLGSFDMFKDVEMRRRLMQSSIKALKEQRLDIKQFNVVQICELISLVAENCPTELPVFYKFVESAGETGLFRGQFDSLSKLFTLFID